MENPHTELGFSNVSAIFFQISDPRCLGSENNKYQIEKKNCLGKYIIYIYIYLAGKSQRISISKVCKPYVSC